MNMESEMSQEKTGIVELFRYIRPKVFSISNIKMSYTSNGGIGFLFVIDQKNNRLHFFHSICSDNDNWSYNICRDILRGRQERWKKAIESSNKDDSFILKHGPIIFIEDDTAFQTNYINHYDRTQSLIENVMTHCMSDYFNWHIATANMIESEIANDCRYVSFGTKKNAITLEQIAFEQNNLRSKFVELYKRNYETESYVRFLTYGIINKFTGAVSSLLSDTDSNTPTDVVNAKITTESIDRLFGFTHVSDDEKNDDMDEKE